MNATTRARAYLAKLPNAVSGSGGHKATLAAACVLVEFGLGYSDAWEVLKDWNRTHCQPPWEERDLCHKLKDAFHRTGPKEKFTGHKESYAGNRHPAPSQENRADDKRPSLERLRAGTEPEFLRLADSRKLGAAGLRLAGERGLLGFGEYQGHQAWFVFDGSRRVAQARRMDGEPWEKNVKARTLRHSRVTWPLGIFETQPFDVVLLCEGGPDLLAAMHFIHAEGRSANATAISMLGAACKIDPSALPMLKGKRVRIFGHNDQAGIDAAKRWFQQLDKAGADADFVVFKGLRRDDNLPVKDLNDFARIHPEDFEEFPELASIIPAIS